MFQLSYCVLSGVYLGLPFLHLHLSLGILLFKMAPESIAEVLSSAPKCQKAGMCLIEKSHVPDTPPPRVGYTYSAVGCEFNVTESTTCIE